MEENLDILKLFKVDKPVVKYYAKYDTETGEVIMVGPSHAFTKTDKKISIDETVAIGILSGDINLNSCYVDVIDRRFIYNQTRDAVKIDDLLHRIVDKEWADHDNPHIFLTYHEKNNTITVEMTEKYFGTKKWPSKYKNIKKERIDWTGDNLLNFLITDYNDPNILFETFSVPISSLIDGSMTIELKHLRSKPFSIFTRRVFKNYSFTQI